MGAGREERVEAEASAGPMRPAALALAAVVLALASAGGTASGRALDGSARADTFDTCDVLTAHQVQAVIPGTPRVTDDASGPQHVANVCDYRTGVARVGGQFSFQLYATRDAALTSWDQYVASEQASSPAQRATVVDGVGEHAFLRTSGTKAPSKRANRLGTIFWIQGRYLFQIQLEATGTRKAVSAGTLALGREAAAKLKRLLD